MTSGVTPTGQRSRTLSGSSSTRTMKEMSRTMLELDLSQMINGVIIHIERRIFLSVN